MSFNDYYHMPVAAFNNAIKIATRQAMYGRPVRRIYWCPPATATGDPLGVFGIEEAPSYSGSDTPCWEE